MVQFRFVVLQIVNKTIQNNPLFSIISTSNVRHWLSHFRRCYQHDWPVMSCMDYSVNMSVLWKVSFPLVTAIWLFCTALLLVRLPDKVVCWNMVVVRLPDKVVSQTWSWSVFPTKLCLKHGRGPSSRQSCLKHGRGPSSRQSCVWDMVVVRLPDKVVFETWSWFVFPTKLCLRHGRGSSSRQNCVWNMVVKCVV